MPRFFAPTSYENPVGRITGISASVTIDMGNLPTLPERLDKHFKTALIFHLKDAAEGIIERAKLSLWKPGDFPMHKHGVDTGLLRESLTMQLVEALLYEGVYYDLLSEEAEYWKWVEFGHWVMNAKTPWFWPGYHYLEGALRDVGPALIMRSLRAAWFDTAKVLATEARVSDLAPSQLLRR